MLSSTLNTYGERRKVGGFPQITSVQARELGCIFGAFSAVRDIYRDGFVSASHIAARYDETKMIKGFEVTAVALPAISRIVFGWHAGFESRAAIG
ncbi:uncharacterized protein N7483_002552 [Penicillium malachiteum]|uniref:uncharacterized protein n=1 Tax=Penicillium malachiteum TaxID=1324776 RepID=UPI0025467BC4|nr:uncharacterized protein N7483_002552 [Penicillium malachiteum]KAJ5737427.1 hypothetical protein N7483_002552 [Penicillium malachiteum]